MLSLYLIGLALFLAIIHGLYLRHQEKEFYFPALFLMYLLFCNVGLMGFLGFFSHTAYSGETANLIGWPLGTPFQYEIAMANLGFGVLGLLCIFIRTLSFWFATIVGSSVFLFGALGVHLYEYYKNRNTAPYNMGLFIWIMDLFVPLLLLALFAFVFKNKDKFTNLPFNK